MKVVGVMLSSAWFCHRRRVYDGASDQLYITTLLLAVMGTYFTHHAITPHQQDCLGKWLKESHAQVASDTHFL